MREIPAAVIPRDSLCRGSFLVGREGRGEKDALVKLGETMQTKCIGGLGFKI